MRNFIARLYQTQKVVLGDTVIETSEFPPTIKLRGFIQLKTYSGQEPRFEGGEAKQLRHLLIETAQSNDFHFLVKNHPSLQGGKEGAYEFLVTKSCKNTQQVDAEVTELKDAKMVSFFSMPLNNPKTWSKEFQPESSHKSNLPHC